MPGNQTGSGFLDHDLAKMDTATLLHAIHEEDRSIYPAISVAMPQIIALTEAAIASLQKGGKIFYIGAGTSGRLGVLDASECPPTFGVPKDLFTGIIAGGSEALSNAIEFAEDDPLKGWLDLHQKNIKKNDLVIGLSASGTTPYTVHALKAAKAVGIKTGCITCLPLTEMAQIADYPVEVLTGPELLSGSTRMKAGTAEKMVLNMISTTAMARLGRVSGNKMVHMQLTNEKLINRGTHILMEELGIQQFNEARKLLLDHGSVKKAMDFYRT